MTAVPQLLLTRIGHRTRGIGLVGDLGTAGTRTRARGSAWCGRRTSVCHIFGTDRKASVDQYLPIAGIQRPDDRICPGSSALADRCHARLPTASRGIRRVRRGEQPGGQHRAGAVRRSARPGATGRSRRGHPRAGPPVRRAPRQLAASCRPAPPAGRHGPRACPKTPRPRLGVAEHPGQQPDHRLQDHQHRHLAAGQHVVADETSVDRHPGRASSRTRGRSPRTGRRRNQVPAPGGNSPAIGWLNRTPAGVGTSSRAAARAGSGPGPAGGASVSSASPHGSGRITMPGPPPYGVSSTVRCTSWVHGPQVVDGQIDVSPVVRPPADQRQLERGEVLGEDRTTSTRRAGAAAGLTGGRSGRCLTQVEQARGRVDDDPATGHVDLGHDGRDERDQDLLPGCCGRAAPGPDPEPGLPGAAAVSRSARWRSARSRAAQARSWSGRPRGSGLDHQQVLPPSAARRSLPRPAGPRW